MIDTFIHAALLTTTPILLASMGGLINRVGGLVNIGLESMMLAGALVAIEVSAATHSVGSVLAAASPPPPSALLIWPLHVARCGRGCKPTKLSSGFGFNVAIAGLVRFILKSAYGVSGTFNPPGVVMLPRFDLPFVADVPLLGASLAGQDALTWFAWASVPMIAFILSIARRTWLTPARDGRCAEATVRGRRSVAPQYSRRSPPVFAGAMAGLAGAHLSIGVVGLFNEGITGGRGFIALAAFYFGRGAPWRTAVGALLFGLFDAAQIRLQGHGAPAELVQMLPYAIVIVVLTGLSLAERRRVGKRIL